MSARLPPDAIARTSAVVAAKAWASGKLDDLMALKEQHGIERYLSNLARRGAHGAGGAEQLDLKQVAQCGLKILDAAHVFCNTIVGAFGASGGGVSRRPIFLESPRFVIGGSLHLWFRASPTVF